MSDDFQKYSIFLAGSNTDSQTEDSQFYNAFLTLDLRTSNSQTDSSSHIFYVLQNIGSSTVDQLFTGMAFVTSQTSAFFVGSSKQTLGVNLLNNFAFASTYPTSSLIANDQRTFQLQMMIDHVAFSISPLMKGDGLFMQQDMNLTIIQIQVASSKLVSLSSRSNLTSTSDASLIP